MKANILRYKIAKLAIVKKLLATLNQLAQK